MLDDYFLPSFGGPRLKRLAGGFVEIFVGGYFCSLRGRLLRLVGGGWQEVLA